jgi:hypothetical protein
MAKFKVVGTRDGEEIVAEITYLTPSGAERIFKKKHPGFHIEDVNYILRLGTAFT